MLKVKMFRHNIRRINYLSVHLVPIMLFLTLVLLSSFFVHLSFYLVQLVLFLPITFLILVCTFRNSIGFNLFFLIFCSSNDVLGQEDSNDKMFSSLQYGWVLYSLHLIYSTRKSLVWNPFVYGVITGSALVLGGGLIFEVLHKTSSLKKCVRPKLFKQIAFNPGKSKLDSCPICMESFKAKELVAILSCTHLYHSWCIDEWFQKKITCPLCRALAI